MASYTISPIWGAGAQLFDNSGNVLTGGKIYTYLAGTTTPATTYATPIGTVANSNPIVANAAGRLTNEIWFPVSGSYKFVLKDANDVLIATYDNIPTTPQPPVVNDASSVSYEPGYEVTAGGFTVGATYLITSVGTTDFVAIGAVANVTGIHFTATGVGSGTGTAEYSRTVQDKLRENVSVKDFGAVGDGVTDDTAAIQAAVDYLGNSNVSGFKKLVFPSGRYYITNTITVPQRNIEIDGQMCQIYARVGSSGPVFLFPSKNLYITVRNFNLYDTVPVGSSFNDISASAFLEFDGGGFLGVKVDNITAFSANAYMSIIHFANCGQGGNSDGIEISRIYAQYSTQTPVAIWFSAPTGDTSLPYTGDCQISQVTLSVSNPYAVNLDDPDNISARGTGYQGAVFLDGVTYHGQIGPWVYCSGSALRGRNGSIANNTNITDIYSEITQAGNLTTSGYPSLIAGVYLQECSVENCNYYTTPANFGAFPSTIYIGTANNTKFINNSIVYEGKDQSYIGHSIVYQLNAGSYGNTVDGLKITTGNDGATYSRNENTFVKAPLGGVYYPPKNTLAYQNLTPSVFNTQISSAGTTDLFTIPSQLLDPGDIFVIRFGFYSVFGGSAVQLNAFGASSMPIQISDTVGHDGFIEMYVSLNAGNEIKTGSSGSVTGTAISTAMRANMDTSPYVGGGGGGVYPTVQGWVTGNNYNNTTSGQQEILVDLFAAAHISVTVSNYGSAVWIKSLTVEQVKANFQRLI